MNPVVVCVIANFFRLFNTFRLGFAFYIFVTEMYGYCTCEERELTIFENIWVFLGYPVEQTCPVLETIVWRMGSKLFFIMAQKFLMKFAGHLIMDVIVRKVKDMISSYLTTFKHWMDELNDSEF